MTGLVVSEIFGPTVSGEGPSLGERCAFLRLMGCNLSCSWCDTPYTWDARRFDLREQGRRLDAEEITRLVLAVRTPLLIVSGGEPLLHQGQAAWEEVLRRITSAGVRVEVETNGTRAPTLLTDGYVTRYVVSPKLTHAGMSEARRICPAALSVLLRTGKAVFKFVCASAADVAETARHAASNGIPPHLIWIMPEGTSSGELCDHLALIADPAIEAGFNVTTRLHVHTWGDERGR